MRQRKKEDVAEGTMAFYFEKPAGFQFKPGQFAYLELLNLPETDAEASYVHVFIGGNPRWDSSLPTAAVSVTPL